MDLIFFLLFASIAVGCGISLVVQKHPIASALSLIGVMGSLAVLYLLLGAEFIAAVQLIVYAGAIMVLFVFVIMLLNAAEEAPSRKTNWPSRLLGVPLLAVFVALLAYLFDKMSPSLGTVTFGAFTTGGKQIGRSLFNNYLLPFEVTSVLVLIAILGAIVLARKEID
ncbi:MAG: NADH-quinone oxidoreductase subunit J [Bryobacter sp.]|jgi:NADH-quinone oxidoreductase subunit J|nr:NADH-quinone oxidoreductase subunit J [Bryobacter sp. CoA8 C33]